MSTPEARTRPGGALPVPARLDERRWLADFPDGWTALGGIHGGAVLALLLAVAARAGGRRPASVSAHFHAPVAAGPLELHAEVVRSGGSAASVSVSALQDNARTSALVLLEGAAGEKTIQGQTQFSDGLPSTSPEDSEPLNLPAGFGPPFAKHVEIRPTGDTRPLAGGERAALQAWIRLRSDVDEEVARASILLDALAPSLFAIWHDPLPVPTIELSAHFAPVAAATPWSAISQRTVWWSENYCVDEAELLNEHGALIAQACQRRRILRPPA